MKQLKTQHSRFSEGKRLKTIIVFACAMIMVPRFAVGQGLFEPYQLSSPLTTMGDVVSNSARVSADGKHVIYIADQNVNEIQELFSVPIGGGTPVRLNSSLPLGGDVTSGSLQISPDSRYVIYIADQITNGVFELFSVPIEGGMPIRLNAPLTSGRNVFSAGAQISPDSTRVTYLADQNTDGVLELFSVPITGGVPQRLNAPLPTGGDVRSMGVHISADSSRVIYLADQNVNDVIELFSVSITGGPLVRLNTVLPSGGEVFSSGLQISGDSNHVVYAATTQQIVLTTELFSVPITGGVPVRLNAPLVAPDDVRRQHTRISGDSSHVVFATEAGGFDGYELFSVPITGGTQVSLARSTAFLASIGNVQISPNNSRVVYTANQGGFDTAFVVQVYSVPIAGGTAVRLNGPLPTDGGVIANSIHIGANSRDVIYLADQNTIDVIELFAVPIAGGPSVRLNSTLASGGDISSTGLQISADSSHVIYLADLDSTAIAKLFRVPIIGGQAIRLNATSSFSSNITQALLSENGSHVVFIGDQDSLDENELYAVRVVESAINDDLCLPIKSSVGGIVVICL